jgi:hypothetical protein
MYSYTYLEKEISKSYRDRLNESKKPSEVQEIFSKSILTLLSKITEELGKYEVSDLKLIPLGKQKYEMSEKMKKDPRLAYLMKESDLPAIIERMAKDAANRYLKLVNDDDKTGTFNLSRKRTKQI